MIVAALLLAAATSVGPHDPALGRYAVRRGALTVCTLTLVHEPTVGGEALASKGCLDPLDDSSRWSGGGKGGFTITDPLRKEVARAVKDQFGYTLFLRDARRFDMVKLRPVGARMRTDAERATGWWSVRTDDPAKVDCRIELKPGGAVGPAARCPASLKPYGGGRWRADTNGVVLTAQGASARALRWGDAVSLLGDAGRLMMLHD